MLISMRRFLNDDGGSTAIEYVLLACFLGLVVYGSVVTVGTKLYDTLLSIW